MLTSVALISLLSFGIGALSIMATRKLFLRFCLASPGGIVLNGGLGIVLGSFACAIAGLFFSHALSREVFGIFLASLVMFLLGVLDDRHELCVTAKFIVQIIAVSVLILSGVKAQIFAFSMPVNVLITFFWMIGMTNAFNHIDVSDGLCASSAIIAGLGLAAVSGLNNDYYALFLTVPLSAATAAFLIFNLPAARVYLGNSGSHFLGFYLAATALFLHYASYGQTIRLISPLLIMALPIVETAFLIVVRLKKRRLPFHKSDDHLALRLALRGYSKKQVLARMAGIALFSAVCGVILSQSRLWFGLAPIILAAAANLFFLWSLSQVNVDGS